MKVKDYDVKYSEKQRRWTCTCPDFKYRRAVIPDGTCKHIDGLLASMNMPLLIPQNRYPRIELAQIVSRIEELPFKHEICGSWRRQRPDLKDLDVVVRLERTQFAEFKEALTYLGHYKYGATERLQIEMSMCSSRSTEPILIPVDFRICYGDPNWIPMMMHFTGSKDENVRLRRIAKSQGMKLNEYGLYRLAEPICCLTEQEIYARLGEEYKEPWER